MSRADTSESKRARVRPSRGTPDTAASDSPRRQRRSGEILAAAKEIFLEKGFAKTSVSDIAAQVGVVEGLVYSYFPNKRELLNEVLRGLYEPLIRDIGQKFERISGLRARLRFLIWRHLRVYVEEPQLSRLVLHEVRTSPEYFGSVLHDLQVRYTHFAVRTVRDAIVAGELPADTEEEMVRSMVYGGIEHRMWATLFGHGRIDVEAAADRYTDMILRGIAPAETPALADPDIERRLARLERIVAAAPNPGKKNSDSQ